MQDFSRPKTVVKNITFNIDNDVFEAYPKIGAELLSSVMNPDNLERVAGYGVNVDVLSDQQRVEALKASQAEMQRIYQFLDQVLLPSSAQRFAARLRSVGDEAIDAPQVFNVYHYLVSAYGQNPTQPSSPSVNGHGEIGTSSTVGVPPDPSTLSSSPPPGS